MVKSGETTFPTYSKHLGRRRRSRQQPTMADQHILDIVHVRMSRSLWSRQRWCLRMEQCRFHAMNFPTAIPVEQRAAGNSTSTTLLLRRKLDLPVVTRKGPVEDRHRVRRNICAQPRNGLAFLFAPHSSSDTSPGSLSEYWYRYPSCTSHKEVILKSKFIHQPILKPVQPN
jgi:hypothetical protein